MRTDPDFLIQTDYAMLLSSAYGHTNSIDAWFQNPLSKFPWDKMCKWEEQYDFFATDEQGQSLFNQLTSLTRIKYRSFFLIFMHQGFHCNYTISKCFNFSEFCHFCSTDIETYSHMYWDCPKSQAVWQYIFKKLNACYCNRFGTDRLHCMLPFEEMRLQLYCTLLLNIIYTIPEFLI